MKTEQQKIGDKITGILRSYGWKYHYEKRYSSVRKDGYKMKLYNVSCDIKENMERIPEIKRMIINQQIKRIWLIYPRNPSIPYTTEYNPDRLIPSPPCHSICFLL